jgi:hypothetical protein
MKMNRTGILLVAGVFVAFAAATSACGSDGETNGTTGSTTSATTTTTGAGGAGGTGGTGSTTTTTTGAGGTGGGGFPAKPALGMEIDRAGRPAISTATVDTFDADMAKTDMNKDKYNSEGDPTKWKDFQPLVEPSIAIIDSLDTVCGNQLLAGASATPGRYSALAGVLVDDRLWVKTDAATCTTYLAVEANATGVVPNMDCGGRKLSYDVVDESYSLLAAGQLSGVTDGVAPDADTNGAEFPYLANPH